MLQPDLQHTNAYLQQTLPLVQNSNNLEGTALEQAVLAWAPTCTDWVNNLGTSPKLTNLQLCFGLDQQSLAFLWLAVLPAIDSSAAGLYSTLTNNLQPVAPTPDAVASLITTSYADKTALLNKLETNSPIFQWGLLSTDKQPDFASAPLTTSAALIAWLGNHAPNLPAALEPVAAPLFTIAADDQQKLPQSSFEVMQGSFEARQLSAVYEMAQSNQRPAYQIMANVFEDSDTAVSDLRHALLVCALQKGIAYWQGGLQDLTQNPELIPAVQDWLQLKNSLFIAGEMRHQPVPHGLPNPEIRVFEPLTFPQKQEVWETAGNSLLGKNTVNWALMNQTYDFAFPRIKNTLLQTQQAVQKGATLTTLLAQEKYVETSPKKLTDLADLDANYSSFDDMVLTKDNQTDLQAAAKAYLNRDFLNPKDPTGVCLVLQGTPGTGKTMAAESLAHQLQLPLYRINYPLLADASGNVEHSLQQLFELAEQNSAALLFDEADALFGTRAAANNPAALTTAYLIQKIEDYSGLSILTTNAKQKIDPAFLRKANQVIAFTPFKPQQRFDLFQKLLATKGVTIDNQVNLKKLVTQLGMNGNHIQSILDKAILSAKSGNEPLEEIVIAAKDLLTAIKQEQQ